MATEVFTVKGAAARIGVSENLVYSLCQDGLLEHTRHGRKGKRGVIRITEGAILAYLESCKHEVRLEKKTYKYV